ncbi:MAG TPA: thioredoxin family protein [Phycisphaerae bacterium]|nr:thioredoxin family protein [Phycisphaerae bacterium]HRY66674.1 thioredoxin family protein [Phycisphaerae bacterium]HSA27623.1 thioredoxin family protein [Phycisphaerae bacterium]
MSDGDDRGGLSGTCPTGGGLCGRKRANWVMAGALLVVAVLYVYASRPVPTAVAWTTDLEAGLRRAAQEDRLVLVKFHASWCGPCKILDRDVFSRSDVARALDPWVPVSVDVDEQSSVGSRFAIQTVPTLMVLSSRGDIVARQVGTLSPKDFIAWLAEAEAKRK